MKVEQVSPSPTSTPQATPITFLNKSEIKIQVLNKTKTPGLAKNVKEALSDFPNIEIGNVEGKEILVTDVTFSSKIGESVKNEVFKILDTMFAEVASKEAELKDKFDILIEVGQTS